MGEGDFVQINSNLRKHNVLNDLNCFFILAMWPKGLLFKEMIHFGFMTLWPHPGSPGGHDTYNFSRILISHHINIILNLFNLCLGQMKKILIEIMHFHYITNMATP